MNSNKSSKTSKKHADWHDIAVAFFSTPNGQQLADGLAGLFVDALGLRYAPPTSEQTQDEAKETAERIRNRRLHPYQVLGLDASAEEWQVKQTYRMFAKRYHPDAGEGADAEKMKIINAAYAAICKERGWAK
jgi:hypothetical protein